MAKRIGKNVRPHLSKARDSALLAVEVFNKPAVSFRSAAYIALMVIAWTALFHAIFFARKKKPYYRKSGKYVMQDGDPKHWELATCLDMYYQKDTQNPVRKNLEFFIKLRNQIEHRHLPELDGNIFGECQAMLLNFDALIAKEFEQKHCLRESLSFSLQLFPSTESFAAAAKTKPSYKSVQSFIEQYRTSIGENILQNGQYSFKAFLIQVANHETKDALAIQFVQYDLLTAEQKAQVEKIPAFIKYKQVAVTNADKFKAGEVVKLVQEATGNQKVTRITGSVNKFNLSTHERFWRKYNVRPAGGSDKPELTNPQYCIYDKPHRDYLYTQSWIDLLIDKMKDDNEYRSLFLS